MSALRKILAALLIGAIFYSAYNALMIESAYRSENIMRKEASQFRPDPYVTQADGDVSAPGEVFANQNILALQEKYPDTAGWLTIPYTGIDYPVVQADDNGEYLRKDLDGNYSLAGSIFMDYRNEKDFSDLNTIIYGHHMKNGTMFGSLKEFNDQLFFNLHKNGTIFLADSTYDIDFFALLVVPVDDDIVFGIPDDKDSALLYFDHIMENASHYREVGLKPEDRIVTLSTCTYEFDNARMVLLGKLSRTD